MSPMDRNLSMNEKLDKVEKLILKAAVASCECGTKTFQEEYHADTCRYKTLMEILSLVEEIKNEQDSCN